GPLPPGGLAGLPGTRVRVRVTSNRPLSGGTVRGAAAADLSPAGDGTEAEGEFAIRTAGKIEIAVVDRDGQPSAEAFTAAVAVLADERPLVRLLEPPEASLATPTGVLPVTVAAEDDYGIARVELYRSLNDSRALPVEGAVPAPPPPSVTQA